MDRVELRSKLLSSRIEKFELDKGIEIYVRPLSALDRARVIDRYRALGKAEESNNSFENMTVETQCFIVSKCLVSQKGERLYQDDDVMKISEEIFCKDLDAISKKILFLSGMLTDFEEQEKNSKPTPSADFSSVLQ